LASTTAYVPKELLGGWLATAADLNPVTYGLAGLRSLVIDGWDVAAITGAVLATGLVAVVSVGLALAALRRRVRVP
jgi:ABC-2 type transport system permease protein